MGSGLRLGLLIDFGVFHDVESVFHHFVNQPRLVHFHRHLAAHLSELGQLNYRIHRMHHLAQRSSCHHETHNNLEEGWTARGGGREEKGGGTSVLFCIAPAIFICAICDTIWFSTVDICAWARDWGVRPWVRATRGVWGCLGHV